MYVTPTSPKGGTKRDLAFFASKMLLLSKEVCYKVSLCENFSGKVVTTSFPYLTVHRWIAGDVPIYLKLAPKVTHPLRNRSTVKAREKVQLSLIGSQQCAFIQAIDEPWALSLQVPQKVVQNENCNILRCLSYLRCR